jgi:hypothetical protein
LKAGGVTKYNAPAVLDLIRGRLDRYRGMADMAGPAVGSTPSRPETDI